MHNNFIKGVKMKADFVFIFCLVVLVLIIALADFDAANKRWCTVYPEWCFDEVNHDKD